MEGRPQKSAFFFIFQFLHTFQNYPLKHTLNNIPIQTTKKYRSNIIFKHAARTTQ